MSKHRFHVVALPHMATAKAHSCCAYTQKVLNFCKMMTGLGHEVIHYGGEGSEVCCEEQVQIMSAAERRRFYGEPGEREFYPIKWDPSLPIWTVPNARAVAEIALRKRKGDFICLIGGLCQKMIADHAGAEVAVVEYGIGYEGCFAPYKVFESYAHLHASIGERKLRNAVRDYEVVIPNYYDLADFPAEPARLPENYLLFVGRICNIKGVQVALDACRAIKAKLVLAGQGVVAVDGRKIITADFTVDDVDVVYAGVLDPARRAHLMTQARALLAPSRYLEPFGGVAAEAQLCGTPVIASDWGAFAETVEHGRTGFRCRTHRHFIDAIQAVDHLDRPAIARRARGLWSLERVGLMYQEYFDMLGDLWEPAGWYGISRQPDDLWLCDLATRQLRSES